MKDYIHYEDIPPEERKRLSKEEYMKDKTARLWNALVYGVSFALALLVTGNAFPDRNDWPGRLIIFFPLSIGLGALFHEAVVKPRIIRLVERRKNS